MLPLAKGERCPAPPRPAVHAVPAEGVEESFVKRNLLRIFGFYSKEATLMRGAQVGQRGYG